MNVRPANMDDAQRVLEIYSIARAFMRQTGNPNQWGEEYPPKSLTLEDIEKKRLFVAEDLSDSKIYAVFVLLTDGDPIYNNIEGNWLNDLPHAAIHRVASSGERRGMLNECINYCLSRSKNLKIDTHEQNAVMQHQLKKLGFSRCGTIYLENGDPRIAFQLYKGI